MSSKATPTQRRGRLILLGIAAVFVLPVIVAAIFTIGPLEWQTNRTVNYGTLVKPALELQTYGLTVQDERAISTGTVPGDWFLVVFHGSECAFMCQHLLDQAERIQTAIGRDRTRVRLALMGRANAPFISEHSQWFIAERERFVADLHRATSSQQSMPVLLIVDHRQRVALMYPPADNAQDVLRDLKRLLKSSAPP